MFMTDDALARYNEYCRHLETQVQDEENEIELAGSYSELEAYAAKIALLLAAAKGVEKDMLEGEDKLKLSIETMLTALMLTEIFKTQVRRLLMTQREHIDEANMKKVETIILKQPGISYRELLQKSHLLAENLKRVLTSLEMDGLISERSKKYFHC